MEIANGLASQSDVIAVKQATDASEARRFAVARAANLSFSEPESGKLSIVVTEISKNLIKHASGGDLLVRSLECGGARGIEVLAVDKGPGIEDIGRCFQDGYSTAGTPGTGLGAIARLSDKYDVYSRRGQGTVVMAQVWAGKGGAPGPRFRVGAVCCAIRGESHSGDGWLFQERPAGSRLVVADGLGHGDSAAAASAAALALACQRPDDMPLALLEGIHNVLRSTRGAAVAVAEIDTRARIVRFAGIGNISAMVIPAAGPWFRMVSHNGTAGHQVHKIVEFTYPWKSDSMLMMHSDGLGSNWSFEPYPGLALRHPSIVSAVLYRDFTRGRDDVTVVAARERGEAS